jgi:hypothetical protein
MIPSTADWMGTVMAVADSDIFVDVDRRKRRKLRRVALQLVPRPHEYILVAYPLK